METKTKIQVMVELMFVQIQKSIELINNLVFFLDHGQLHLVP